MDSIHVEVAYATAARQVALLARVPRGTTVEQAIRYSGVLQRFPEIDLARNAVGIFGERARLTDVVGAGDRIEIYRPLVGQPKRTHRQRAVRPRSK